MARLANQCFVTFARSFVGNRVPLHVFLDEAHEVVGTAAIDGMLRQARDFGLSYWLACQQLSALRAGQHDCLDAITGNVALQMHFSATDRTGHEHLIRLSGQSSRWLSGEADTADGLRTQRRETIETRLTAEDVARLNSVSGFAATLVTPRTPLAPFRHIFFLRTGYAISAQAFRQYRAMPFPHPTRFTVFNRGAEPRLAPPPGENIDVAPPQVHPRPAAPQQVPAAAASPAPRPASQQPVSTAPSADASTATNQEKTPQTQAPAASKAATPKRQQTTRSATSPRPTPKAAKPSRSRTLKKPPPKQQQARAEDSSTTPNPDLAIYLEQLRLADSLPPSVAPQLDATE